MTRRWGLLATAVAVVASGVAVVWAAPSVIAPAATRMSSLPQVGTPLPAVSDGDFGDPFVLTVPPGSAVHGFRYIVYATANWEQRVPTAVSSDLRTWTDGPDALPSLPTWAMPDPGLRNAWGPAVITLDGGYRMYYTTKARTGIECLSVALAENPLGPFRDRSGAPLVCQSQFGGAIDPSPVLLPDGSLQLVWRSVGHPGRDHSTAIWTQALSADGMAMVGRPTLLLRADRSWEAGVVEGPSMSFLDGRWWLFFSANSYRTSAYSTGVAACRGPTGPCSAARQPLLSSGPSTRGPGGLEVFRADDGAAWVVFHTWRLPGQGNPHERQIHLAPLVCPTSC